MATETRVAVFIDYQNTYMGARNAFCPQSSNHIDGQINPLALAGILKGVRSPHRQLVGVWIYRGLPSGEHDRKAFGAATRQVAMWDKHPLVHPRTRPLNYRVPDQPREKGIDVLLAIDFVTMALRNQYDVGVPVSADTDLMPALETVIDHRRSDAAVEVAGWVPADGRPPNVLGVKGHVIHKHGLHYREYSMVHDATDYLVRRRRR